MSHNIRQRRAYTGRQVLAGDQSITAQGACIPGAQSRRPLKSALAVPRCNGPGSPVGNAQNKPQCSSLLGGVAEAAHVLLKSVGHAVAPQIGGALLPEPQPAQRKADELQAWRVGGVGRMGGRHRGMGRTAMAAAARHLQAALPCAEHLHQLPQRMRMTTPLARRSGAASHHTTPREAPRASCCGSQGRTRGSCRGEVGAGRRGAGAQVGLPDVYHAAACTCARRLCALAHGSNYPMAATEAAPTTACRQHQGRRATCGNTGANS